MRNWYKVGELIEKLKECPPGADVLLVDGVFDAKKANEATFGIPDGLQAMGLNSLFAFDSHHVYLLHSTEPDLIEPLELNPQVSDE